MCSLLLMSGMYELMEYKIAPIVKYKWKYRDYTDFGNVRKCLSNDSIAKIMNYVMTEKEFKHFTHFHKPTFARLQGIYMTNRVRFEKIIFDFMCNINDNPIIYNRPMWNDMKHNLVLFEDCCGNKKCGVIVGNNGRYGNNITLFKIMVDNRHRKKGTQLHSYNINLTGNRVMLNGKDREVIVVPTNKIITNIFKLEDGDRWCPEYRNYDEPLNIRISRTADFNIHNAMTNLITPLVHKAGFSPLPHNQ